MTDMKRISEDRSIERNGLTKVTPMLENSKVIQRRKKEKKKEGRNEGKNYFYTFDQNYEVYRESYYNSCDNC